MTEIQCPACSALLNLSLADPGSDKRIFSEPQQPVIESKARQEALRLAQFNADLAAALREFLAVFPWSGHRLSADIQEGFVSWLRGAPEDRGFGKFLYPVPVTKNRVSKLLVSEIGATFIKGAKGREYRLPESLQPAGGDDPGAVARAHLAGEGSLAMEGVASLPLAAHVAAVKAQAAAEDAVSVDPESPIKEAVMQEHSPLPDHLVLDGPSVIPVAEPEGGWTPPVTRKWGVLLTDSEAELEPAELEMLFMQRLPDNLLLQGAVDLEYRVDGTPALLGLVASLDGSDPGDGFVPLPSSDVAFVEMHPSREAVAEAAAAPLPSSAELAAVAGHEALERARTAAAGPVPVFLAAEDLDDYEGADPGDWG